MFLNCFNTHFIHIATLFLFFFFYVFLFHLHAHLISVMCGQDKSMRLLWLWRLKDMSGWESRLSTVRPSCGRLSLSSTPLGLISSACLQREGDPQGQIITQATALLQRCSLHWNNPQYTLLLLRKEKLCLLYASQESLHVYIHS